MIRIAAAGLLVFLSCSQVKQAHKFQPLPNAIPRLTILGDTAASAIKMSVLDIKTEIAANIATTTFEISFYNPNDRILEGEFEFPLADGQHITRYGIDIDGKLREGVVVEKPKARIAFENTVRQKIDPGLVEKTAGNNFRTRIYPIPSKGYRRILIATEQTLSRSDEDLLYQLPMHGTEVIDSFSINITVIHGTGKPQLDEDGLPLNFENERENYTAGFSQLNYVADKSVAFSIPDTDDGPVVLTETFEGENYFYLHDMVKAKHKKKKMPSTIGILWDVSSSGANRDLDNELLLLTSYLKEIGNVTVSLIPFNIHEKEKEEFSIAGGNTQILIDRIRSLEYDGGTQYGAIDLSKYHFDEILLFSDGLSTFGKRDMKFGTSPVYAVTSAPSANHSALKYIARETGGQVIDLGKITAEAAMEELNGQSLRVINIVYDSTKITGLARQGSSLLSNGISLSGKLTTATATIEVQYGFGDEIKETVLFDLDINNRKSYDKVKRIWAGMKINELDLDYPKNKDAITRLGKKYSIVTQNTSLIVLDRVEDYVEHEIVPPAELQNEYYTLLHQKQTENNDEKISALASAREIMKDLKRWWRKDFRVSKKTTPVTIGENGLDTTRMATVTDAAQFLLVDSIPSPPSMEESTIRQDVTAGLGSVDTLELSSGWGGSVGLTMTIGSMVPNHFTTESDGDGVPDRAEDESARNEQQRPAIKSIEINNSMLDQKFIQSLAMLSPTERRKEYYRIKKDFTSQPSFYIDVSRFFLDKGEREFAILVLSNLSEMKLENAELLRIVGNQLMELEEYELAILTFQEVLNIREEDPQSPRDLALAYNEHGDYNNAVSHLMKLILGTWDSRFGDVKAIALTEMNGIISARGPVVDISQVDPALIFPMPVDVRIVVGWTSDNSDIDLWVTDPRMEKCDYTHRETEIGGAISQDVTMGYGPEEFRLKKAWNGNYKVQANLYGDHRQGIGEKITIKADLFTDFGRPSQKRKTINLRFSGDGQVVDIGSLKFKS